MLDSWLEKVEKAKTKQDAGLVKYGLRQEKDEAHEGGRGGIGYELVGWVEEDEVWGPDMTLLVK